MYFDEVGAHAGHECDGDVDEVDGSPPQKYVEPDEIAAADALAGPGAVVIVLLYAHVAVVAVPRVTGHHQRALAALLLLLL